MASHKLSQKIPLYRKGMEDFLYLCPQNMVLAETFA